MHAEGRIRWAFAQVFLGYRVRRASWTDGRHLFKGNGIHNGLPKVMLYAPGTTPRRFQISVDDFHARDWVLLL